MASLKGFAVIRVATGLSGIAIPLILVRWMSVEEFAQYLIAVSAISIAGIVSGFGMDRVLYRFLPEAYLRNDAVFARKLIGAAFAPRVVLAPVVVIAILTALVPLRAQEAIWLPISLGCALAIIVGLSEVVGHAASSLMKFQLQAAIVFAGIVVRLAVLCAISLLVGVLKLVWVLLILVGIEFLQLLVVGFAVVLPVLRRMRIAGGGGERASWPSWRALGKMALSNYGSYILGLPWQGSVLRVIVGVHSEAAVIATFGFLQTLADRLKQYLPMQILQTAVEPVMVRRFAEGEDLKVIIGQLDLLRRVSSYPIIGLAVVFAIAGDPIVSIVTGGKYTDAGMLAALILLGLAASTISSVLWISSSIAHEMPLLLGRFALISVFLFPVMWIAAKYCGGLGVAVVAMLVSPMLWCALRWSSSKATAGTWDWSKDLRVVVLAIALVVIGRSLVHDMAVVACIAVAGGAFLAYAAGLVILRALRRKDLEVLKELLATSVLAKGS